MHDVQRFVNGLSQKLATRSRHVCVFLGAGAARACGLPDVAGLEAHLLDSLTGDQLATFRRLLERRNLEQVLSRLRRIAVLLEGTADLVDQLTAAQARELDTDICRLVVAKLDIEGADMTAMLSLAAWAARADYHQPVELFTVNYDLLIETALERLGVAYFDGYVGALEARFRSDLVEAVPTGDRHSIPEWMVRVWKLHGSVHWSWNTDPRPSVVRLGRPVPDGQPAAIYPSDAKYDESRRVPFVVLQDRLRRAINQPETLVLVSGYAFADQHLNEMLFDAARRRPRSEFLVFCYDAIPDDLAALAEKTPNVQVVTKTEAILSGIRGSWQEPNDAQADVWAGKEFQLGDFKQLSHFLARSSPPDAELETRLAELLRAATPGTSSA